MNPKPPLNKRQDLMNWIGGTPDLFGLRRRLFNVIQFLSALIAFGSLLANSYLGFIDEMLIFSSICIVLTMGLWFVGRWSYLSIHALGVSTVIIAFLIFGGSWIFFGGERGMTPPLLFWMLCLLFLFDQKIAQIAVVIGTLSFAILLFSLESYYPDLIHSYYPNEASRYADVAITYLLTLGGYSVLVLSMIWLHTDTSKRLQAEQELRANLQQQSIRDKASEQEERLALLRRMSRGLAHDLNNLLMVISNSAEMIDASISNRSETDVGMIDDLNAVIDTAAAASRLTRRLLDHSLTDHVTPDVISLSSFLEAQVPILSRISQNITIHLDSDDHQAPVLIHRSELEQVIMNLALNAIQAMNHQGDLYLRCHVQDDHAVIKIEDTGQGIAPEHLPLIFEPLFTTKLESGGTGIGLSTVRSIIQRYQGQVTVSSQVGVGTCFCINLPLNNPTECNHEGNIDIAL